MSQVIQYRPNGVCCSLITITYNNGIIEDVHFNGGCSGNTQGVASLLKGLTIEDAIKRLKGIKCRNGTSCPDQLALALETSK